MNRRHLLTVLSISVLLTACDSSSPLGPEGDGSEAVLEELALLALANGESEGVPLPSYDRLVRLTFQAVQADPTAQAEGLELLKRARRRAKLAQEAHKAGDHAAAKDHANRSRGLTLSAILMVLGEGTVSGAVQGVDQALARLDANLAGKELTDRIRKTLDRARALSARSHEALESGKLPGALNAALFAADQIRSLSPRYQARKAIERSTRALRAAHEAIKADPTTAETDALKKAQRHLKKAKEALEAKDFKAAIRRASEAGRLAMEVLQGRSEG